MNTSIKKGAFWSLSGQIGYFSIALIAQLILARLLGPREFGQLGIIVFFMSFARVFAEAGLGGALIRNNNATEKDFSTIFLFNLSVSGFLSLILIFSAGYVAVFYQDPALKNLLIVSSFILILNAFQFVQNAKLVKYMRFKQKAIYEITSISCGALVGILLALDGFGTWSLIIMQLTTALILTLLLWFFEGSHGKIQFSKESFRFHYKFGVNTTIASLINQFFGNIYQAILGKYFTIGQTGLYYQAKKLQDIPLGIINTLTQGVVFSGLSKIQDHEDIFIDAYQRIMRVFTVMVGFICLIIFVFAEELILLLLGNKWIDSTFFLQLLTIVAFFNIQEKFNRILFKIHNETKYILYLELVSKGILIISIVTGLLSSSLSVLMYGFAISSILSYGLNYFYVRKKYFSVVQSSLSYVLKTLLIILIIVLFEIFFIEFSPNFTSIFLRIIITLPMFIIGIMYFKLVNFKREILSLINKS